MLALIAPQFLIAALVLYGGAIDDHYFKAIPAKYQIASETQSPKIVLAGGSSVAWGTDSGAFSDTCERPCVNLGVNAGQGIAFRFAEAAAFCNVGDSLVLSLEYNELSTKPYGEIIAKTILYSPTSIKFLRAEEWKAALDQGALENIANRARTLAAKLTNQRKEDPFYRNSNFDKRGDFIGHKDKTSNKKPDLTLQISPAATVYLGRLKSFDQHCLSRGVTVFYRLPCIPRSAVAGTGTLAALERIERQLKEVFGDRMLNRLPETLLEDDCFFDTAYHLVHREKIRISKILANRLSEKISQ